MAGGDFLQTTFGAKGWPVFRLGISGTYRPGEQVIRRALDAGVNFFFCYGFDTHTTHALAALKAAERERVRISTGAYNLLWTYPNIRRTLEKRLRQLKTDYIDVFHFLGVTGRKPLTERALDELAALRADPRVRAIGMSCHDRRYTGELLGRGALDCAMVRYNAAHRGAETDVFPHLTAHDPGIISYTATRWGYLLRRPRRWPKEKPLPTAGECYRFVLSNPHVHVCLSAPSNARHLEANLAAVREGPLDEEKMAWMREFGDLVHATAGWFM